MTSNPNKRMHPTRMMMGDIQDAEFHLHDSFIYWISRLANLMQEQFNRHLHARDVTWPQWMLLNVLHDRLARSPAQIAEHIGVDRSAITRLVDRLERKGLVARQHDGLDRRSIKIELTAPGQTMMSELNRAARAHQNRFLSQLPMAEYGGLKGNIQKMLRAGGVESDLLWKQVEWRTIEMDDVSAPDLHTRAAQHHPDNEHHCQNENDRENHSGHNIG